jgi:hypothetical protein
MSRVQHVAVIEELYSAIVPNIVTLLKNNGTGFRYLHLSGWKMIVNSRLAERFTVIMQ